MSRTRSTRPASVPFDGQMFETYDILARYLAEVTGRSHGSCLVALERFGHDPARVVEHHKPIIVGGKTYRTKAEFYAYLGLRYHVPHGTVIGWRASRRGGALSLEEMLSRAKSGWSPRPYRGEVVLFGW